MGLLRFLSVAAWLAGCAGAADVSSTSTTAAVVRAGSVVRGDHALDEVIHTECARAQACGARAAPGVYFGADYCATNLEPAARDELGRACPRVDATRLAVCLDAVRRAPCAVMSETVRPPWPCRRAALCGR